MRQSRILVAAFSALLIAAPGSAFGFDVQTLGGTNPDGSPMLMDPDAAASGKDVAPGAPNGAYLKGLQLQLEKSSTPVTSFTGSADNGWQHLAPIGRITR